jgi:hypothetical protein
LSYYHLYLYHYSDLYTDKGDDPDKSNDGNDNTGNFSRTGNFRRNPTFDDNYQGTGTFSAATNVSKQEKMPQALQRLLYGRGSFTAEGREQQALEMLLVPYRPSDNPPKLKQVVMLINNVRNSPRQLQMWMNHHAIYGSTLYMVMIGLYNGECLATANNQVWSLI